MAVTNAVYDGGESKLPQARPTSAVSPAYVDGESGKLPILAYVAVAGTTYFIPGIMRTHFIPSLGGR